MANIRSPGVAVPSAAETALYNMTSPSHSFLPKAQGGSTWLFTTATIVVSLLLLEQAVYKYKKRHLPGASWTIPIIGKFMDSLHPTLENYMKQWAMGDLSVVSVFNMYVLAIHTRLGLTASCQFHRDGGLKRLFAEDPQHAMCRAGGCQLCEARSLPRELVRVLSTRLYHLLTIA